VRPQRAQYVAEAAPSHSATAAPKLLLLLRYYSVATERWNATIDG
jgi:hypothetical protein